jgi:hypothetical protein
MSDNVLSRKVETVTLGGKTYDIAPPTRNQSRPVREAIAAFVESGQIVNATKEGVAALLRQGDEVVDLLRFVPGIAEDWERIQDEVPEYELNEALEVLLRVYQDPFAQRVGILAAAIRR